MLYVTERGGQAVLREGGRLCCMSLREGGRLC